MGGQFLKLGRGLDIYMGIGDIIRVLGLAKPFKEETECRTSLYFEQSLTVKRLG